MDTIQSIVKYGTLVTTTLEITIIINNNDHDCYESIWNNFNNIIDYLLLDKYRNIKNLLSLLKHVRIDTVIEFKYRYGYDMFDKVLKNNFVNLMNYRLPSIVCKYPYLINNLHIICDKYGDNIYTNKFIEILGSNIDKITSFNINNIYTIFVLVYLNKFIGFKTWGPGNNKTPDLNIIAHYNKHVVDNKNENWKKYLNRLNVDEYKNFAINISQFMTNKIVHTNGVKVYLSGFYNDVLIIGRLDRNKNLGISSCYIVSDNSYNAKIQSFLNNCCFKL